MTGGKSPIGYLKAYLTNLYLSADSEKVQEAIQEGINLVLSLQLVTGSALMAAYLRFPVGLCGLCSVCSGLVSAQVAALRFDLPGGGASIMIVLQPI